MYYCKVLILSFIFLLLAFFSVNADLVEWEFVPGAVSYQFQVVDDMEKIVQEKKDLKENKIELTITKPGKYKYKIGVVDKLGNVVYGEWVEFDIEENAVMSGGKEYLVQLEWIAVEGATSYFVEIVNLAGKLVKALKTKTNQKEVKLKIGKYQFRTSYEKNGVKVWSDWKEMEVKVPEEKKKPFLSERMNVLWRSALIPGWGQNYRQDAKWRVWVYPILLLPMFLVSANTYQNNHVTKEKFNSQMNELLIMQVYDSPVSNSMSLLTYHNSLSLREEINSTNSLGRTMSMGIAAIYLLNLIDAHFFYDYKVPIADRYKKPALSLQFYSPYNLATGTRESVYSVSYQFSF